MNTLGDPFELAGTHFPNYGTMFIPWPQIVFVPIYIEHLQPGFGMLPERQQVVPYVGGIVPERWTFTC